jgi:hypothetical protein
LIARTLPLPPAETTPTSGATYERAGALHFENDPVKAGPALEAAGVDAVSENRSMIYQAKYPASAAQLVQAYGDVVAASPAAQPAEQVPGLPQSRCTMVPGSGGLVPHHWCIAAVGRYMIKAIAPTRFRPTSRSPRSTAS